LAAPTVTKVVERVHLTYFHVTSMEARSSHVEDGRPRAAAVLGALMPALNVRMIRNYD